MGEVSLPIIYSLVILTVVSIIKTSRSGRDIAANRFVGGIVKSIENHRRWANTSLVSIFFLVVAIEASVRFGGLPPINHLSLIFICHMISNVVYIGGLITARFFITGLDNPELHRMITRITIAASLGTIVTGLALLRGLG